MKKLAILSVVGLTLLMGGCTDSDGARKALADQGYEKVQITGYRWFKCDEKDVFSTGFTAYRGDRYVKGTVCSGWFKGNTIRTD